MISQKKLGKKIKELRDNINLSQDDLAKKIGISRAAVSEIERGNRGIETTEIAKIADMFGLSIDSLLRDEDPIDGKAIAREKDKKFIFSPDKLKNTLLYILEKCAGKPNVGETVLYKLLYFIDFDSFELTGKPIMNLSYVHLKFGPVPMASQYVDVVKEMVDDNQLKIISQLYFGMPQKRYINLINYSLGSLEPKEIEVIDEVINCLSGMTAKRIEDYVHEDAPWKLVEDKQIIPYNLVFQRKVPYAKKNYDELWHASAVADTLKELGPMSDEEYKYYKNLKS